MSIAEALAKSIAHVARDHYKEKKRLERGHRRSYRGWTAPRPVLKDAVFEAMPQAIARASSNGALPFTVRQLYYQIRPLIQGVDRELDYAYFTPPLVTEYEEMNGPIRGLMYDARGHLVGPAGRHPPCPACGRSLPQDLIPLGTAAVQAYAIPQWDYKAILYIEKEGFGPIFEATHFAERHDIALMMGKGYAVRAAKTLLKAARGHDITVLVLHDCDLDGYEIARTLAYGTRTTRFHHVDISDIGLRVADVTGMGLETERVSMRKAPSWQFERGLTSEERDFFLGQRLRTELNAMTSEQLIEYVERKLEEHGLTSKVVPPEDVVVTEFKAASEEPLRRAAQALVRRALKENLGIAVDELNEEALRLLCAGQEPGVFYKEMVTDLNDGDREMSWRVYVAEKAGQHIEKWAKKKGKAVTAKIGPMLRPTPPSETTATPSRQRATRWH